MKKLIASILVLSLILCSISVPVHAATPSEISPQASAIPDPTSFLCPKCSTHGTVIQTWVEPNYYGSYIWNTLECPECEHVWSVCFQLNSMASITNPETDHVSAE